MILAPIDRSSRDRLVLPQCARLGKALDVPVVLLHVIAPTKAIFPSANREAEAYADAVTASLAEEGVSARAEIRRGDPTTIIVAVAAELEPAFIVMATRGRRGLDKFALGSVTDAVVAYARAPVIILNEAEAPDIVDDTTKAQSAYLATVVWNKQARGVIDEAEAATELEHLASQGLDRKTLYSTYRAHLEQGGPAIDWLDLDFQRKTLDSYLSDTAAQDGATNVA